jgi:hypothetical protein
MSVSFAPCPSCDRHVKRGEAACPFCGVAVVLPPAAPRPSVRLSRSALFALTAAGALAATDCGGTTSEPLYGAPVPGVDASSDAPQDGSFQALYGAMPAPDGGQLQDSSPNIDATGIALYGGAPPPPGRG